MGNKLLSLLLLIPLLIMAGGMMGCDDEDIIKAAAAKGIFLQKKQVEEPAGSGKMVEKFVVVQDPTKSPIDQGLGAAQGIAGGIPVVGQILGILGLVSSLGGNYLLNRMKAIADKKNAELAAQNEQHEATHNATSLALQKFVDVHPPEIGKALVDHLDSVHDHMEVPAEHQDWIQPALKTG